MKTVVMSYAVFVFKAVVILPSTADVDGTGTGHREDTFLRFHGHNSGLLVAHARARRSSGFLVAHASYVDVLLAALEDGTEDGS